jgi:DNA invertase Pin-like site-specific DNA recombinase
LSPRSAQTPKKGTKVPAGQAAQAADAAKKLAISYQRVSTTVQTEETKSGLTRQKRARDQWLAANPDYRLADTVEVAISGRKKNRFNWFTNGDYPPGTVLLVEDIDRFSRMEVDAGIRELLAIFTKGLAIAVCPYEQDEYSVWNRLGIITDFNRGGEEIVRELQRARRESERKRERRRGAVDKKYEAIREGNLNAAFKPRGKSKSAKSFPFWVELNPKANDGRGVFEFNEHYPLIARIWELARTMGGARIAEVLMEEGYTSPHPRKGKKKALSDEVVRNILRRRSAVGEFQPTTKGNKPNGDPIPGVFPQVITEAEWKEIRGIIEERDTGLGHSKTKKKANLFEKRSFCANCGGLQGVAPTTAKRLADGSIKEQPGKFRCRVGHKTRGRDCNVNGKQIGVIYDEDALLELLHDFQWEDRYSSTAHGEEINQARQHLLALEGTKGQKQRTLDNIKQGIKAALIGGQAPDPTFIEIQKEAGVELIDAENAVAIAESRLNALQSKTVGKAAAREARARVKAFMAVGRDDVAEREKFNEWFHSTGLVVVVDPRTKQCQILTGRIQDNRLQGVHWGDKVLAGLHEDIARFKGDQKADFKALLKEYEQWLAHYRQTGVKEKLLALMPKANLRAELTDDNGWIFHDAGGDLGWEYFSQGKLWVKNRETGQYEESDCVYKDRDLLGQNLAKKYVVDSLYGTIPLSEVRGAERGPQGRTLVNIDGEWVEGYAEMVDGELVMRAGPRPEPET